MIYSFLELLINSSRCLLIGVYFSLHQRNIAYKYKLQRKYVMKYKQRDTHFHLPLTLMLKNSLFMQS